MKLKLNRGGGQSMLLGLQPQDGCGIRIPVNGISLEAHCSEDEPGTHISPRCQFNELTEDRGEVQMIMRYGDDSKYRANRAHETAISSAPPELRRHFCVLSIGSSHSAGSGKLPNLSGISL